MFGNLGVHIIDFPSGRFGFVGTLPLTLVDEWREPTSDDVRAGRTVQQADGTYKTPHFPTFATRAEAEAYRDSRMGSR